MTPIGIEDFVEVLRFTGATSPVLVEMVCSLIGLLVRDHSMSTRLSTAVPSHLNFASRDSVEDAVKELLESYIVESYQDWEYNGLKLLPRKIRGDVVDGLRWQCVLRALIPRLPSFRDMLRSNDVAFDLLVSSEERAGLFREGHHTPNRDYELGITSNNQDACNDNEES